MNSRTLQRAEQDPRETIASVLRQAGLSVIVTNLDDGFPQFVIGGDGACLLAFVKANGQGLTDEEREFRRTWSGPPILTLRSADEALEQIGRWINRSTRVDR